MKRDIELIRELFFIIETFPPKIKDNFDYSINVEGYDRETIDFHLYLMKQANLIDGIINRSIINNTISVINAKLEITWEGYEFFNSVKEKSVWDKIITKLKGADLPMSTIKEAAKTILNQSVHTIIQSQ